VPDAPPPAPSEAEILRQIVDTSATVIVGLRPDGTVFEWNPAAATLYGMDRDAVLGVDYVERFIAPEQRDGVRADIRKVLGGNPTTGYADDSVLADGSRRTLVWNVRRVLAPDGTPYGVVAIGQDITQWLRDQELFRLVFEHSSDGLVIGDTDGVIDCNPAALAMLGLTERSQLVGRSAAHWSPPFQPDGAPSREKSREYGDETARRGAMRFEWMHRSADGRDVPVDVTVRRARFAGREISVATWHDLSARRAREAERAALEQRLFAAQKLESVGHLAGGIAHDFNNLLTALRGAVELARIEVGDTHAATAELDLALGVADRAAALTRQLLLVGRRATPVAHRPVDLARVVDDALAIARRSMPPTIDFDVALPERAVPVLGDEGQLELVVLNLVLNARDAMPDGGIVTVELEVAEGAAMLRVADTGTGMDAATQARVFDPFFSTKPVSHGTGLGLAVVYGIVSQAGGTVTVRSAPGDGAAFTVTLPCTDGEIATVDAPVPEGGDPGGAVVLLVEDEAQVRATARRTLERAGYVVLEARHGADALTLVRERGDRIALVLTDVRMPEMDGASLARALEREAPALPVVFMSGYDRLGLGETSALPPGARFVEKPFAREALLATLRDALAGAATR
jgi:PAS domain S-box-containing protein